MEKTTLNVLLVEDIFVDAARVMEMLAHDAREYEFKVEHVRSGKEALDRLAVGPYNVILLDLTLPDMRGMETVKTVVDAVPEIPIVILSALGEEKLAIETVQSGAQDFLVKGKFDAALLGRSILYAIERKRSEARINYLAFYDELTGLPNRSLIHDRLSVALARAKRRKQCAVVMFIDLDNFKAINDTLGHRVGDLVLREVARRLSSCIRAMDTVGRVGGDEFVLLMPEIGREDEIVSTAERILAELRPPCIIGKNEISVSASMGISQYPSDGENETSLLKSADAAMYRAKEYGRNQYQFSSSGLSAGVSERLVFGNALRRALDKEEFRLYYQPLYDMKSGQLVSVEAFIRWDHPEWGLVPPGHFLPLAEESGLIHPIGDWVLRSACQQSRAWRQDSSSPPSLVINISQRQLKNEDLAALIGSILEESDLPPEALELDLGENGLVHHEDSKLHVLQELKMLGVRIAIDDFGAGCSSFKHLRALPIDALKIDPSYINAIANSAADSAIVSAIILMAHSLGLQVVAQGVETCSQLRLLKEKGCDLVQGYYISPPVPAETICDLARKKGPRTI